MRKYLYFYVASVFIAGDGSGHSSHSLTLALALSALMKVGRDGDWDVVISGKNNN